MQILIVLRNCDMEKVGIVIVTYNRFVLLKEVIDAIREQTYKEFQIIVVNNGSTDGTSDWLNSQNDIIVITQENLGGAGGFYTGMKYVVNSGFEYCWIMDDDVICQPSALSELIEAYHVDPSAGFVCSNVVGITGEPMNTPQPIMNTEEKRLGVIDYTNVFEKVMNYSMVRVEKATFVSVLFNTKIIEEVGLPYRDYFIWGDDYEYTSRISSHFPCYIACRSVVIHKRSIQTALSFRTEKDPRRLKNYFYMYRNNMHAYMKNTKISLIKKILRYCKVCMEMFSYFVKCDFRRAYVIFRALLSLLLFHPQIDYPTKK